MSENGIYNLINTERPCESIENIENDFISPARVFELYKEEIVGVLPNYAYHSLDSGWAIRLQKNYLMLTLSGKIINSLQVAVALEDPTFLQISGGDIYAGNGSCWCGVFHKLCKCTAAIHAYNQRMAAASETELFLMDGKSGLVVGLPVFGPYPPEMLMFFSEYRKHLPRIRRPTIVPQQLERASMAEFRIAAPFAEVAGFSPYQLRIEDDQLLQILGSYEQSKHYFFTTEIPSQRGELMYCHWIPRFELGCEAYAEDSCSGILFKCGPYPQGCACERKRCNKRLKRLLDVEDSACEASQPVIEENKVILVRGNKTESSHLKVIEESPYKHARADDSVKRPSVIYNLYSERPECTEFQTYNSVTNRCDAKEEEPLVIVSEANDDYSECSPTQITLSPSGPPATAPSPSCTPGITFLSNNICVLCSNCRAGQFMKSQCNITQDRMCSPCPDGFYMDEPAHTDTACKKLNGCKGGNRFRNGTCISFVWFKDHWWIFLNFFVVIYLVLAISWAKKAMKARD